MTQNNEQRTIIEGLSIGNEANQKIADVVAARTAKMLDQSLQENFETVLEAQVTMAVQETLNIHNQRTQAWAKKFLGSGKTRLAQSMVDTQQNHQLNSLQSNLSLEGLEDFETDLLPEVSKLADESGAITIEANPSSSIGF
ncbi:MAG: hypothetical protein AB4063_04565 [Crocosphaera sp.]